MSKIKKVTVMRKKVVSFLGNNRGDTVELMTKKVISF